MVCTLLTLIQAAIFCVHFFESFSKLVCGYRDGMETGDELQAACGPSFAGTAGSLGTWLPHPCTVRKMGLILRSIERMLKMQFSIAVSLRFSCYADMA
jgi:hypothetical protein